MGAGICVRNSICVLNALKSFHQPMTIRKYISLHKMEKTPVSGNW